MFKQRIKDLCDKNGITQKELINELNLGTNFIQQANNPRKDKMMKIANYFDVSIDYLVGRTDNPDSHKL